MRVVTKLGVAGDWHGNRRWALHSIRALADADVHEIFHLGDFGIWPGRSGRDYLLEVTSALDSYGMKMFVTPGNHEDYDQIAELPALDLGQQIGAVQWITDHIALLPRGHRWERNGWSFVSVGGAPSVDRRLRREGVDWWPAEAITEADVRRVVAGGPADVMLAHDAPDSPHGTAAVARILGGNPNGLLPDALRYADEGRQLMTAAFRGVRPRLFMHGHYHVRDAIQTHEFGHATDVVALDCDGSDGNVVVLSLPPRDSGAEPSIHGLT